MFEQGLKTELQTIVPNIFHVTVLDGTSPSPPYLVYELTNTERQKTLNNYNGNIEAQYELNVYETSYANLKIYMRNLITLLKGLWGRNIGTSGPYIQSVTIINEQVLYESEVGQYRGLIEFSVFYDES